MIAAIRAGIRRGRRAPGSRKPGHTRWVSYAACAWCVAFGAPHAWWALGIPTGFPGGMSSYQVFMSSAWRYAYDVAVVLLSLVGVLVAIAPLRPKPGGQGQRVTRAVAWIACALLGLRGVAGLIVDGASDLIWWPTFLLGGILFGGVALTLRRVR